MRALLLEPARAAATTCLPTSCGAAIRRWLEAAGDEAADRTAELLASTIGAADLELADRTALFAAWRSHDRARRRPATARPRRRGPPLVERQPARPRRVHPPAPRRDAAAHDRPRPARAARPPADWGGGRRNFVSLTLEPLDDAEVAELVAYLLEAPARTSSREHRRPRGRQPVLCRRDRPLDRRARRPTCATTAAVETGLAALPDTVQATVLARLDLPARRRAAASSSSGRSSGRTFRLGGLAALEPDAGRLARAGRRRAGRAGPRPAGGPRRATRSATSSSARSPTEP